MAKTDPDQLLDAAAVAKLLGYDRVKTVYDLPIVRTEHGRRVRWRRGDVEAYIRNGRVAPAARATLAEQASPQPRRKARPRVEGEHVADWAS